MPVLLRYARFHSRCDSDAEDAVHDASLAFLRSYSGPPGDDALRWMKAVTRNAAWAIGRRARRIGSTHHSAPDACDRQAASADALDGAERCVRAEETAEIVAFLGALKPDERAALLLFGAGFSYAEIASMRGWTRTKVNRCLAEGRARMRSLMDGGERS